MSGGVDSSLAAILLTQQGFNVFGVTMKLWDYEDVGGAQNDKSSCCNIDLIEGAKAVCAKHNIPHHVLNLAKDFKESVIADFIEEYSQGRTPNPCVVCNPRIKFARSLNHRKNRQKTGLFLVEGIKHTGEVADSSFEIETLLYSEDLLKSDYDYKLVEKLSGEGIPK